ncbi:helix-turn-helix domain-containing protein [Acidimicrobiaceae bacterium]|nr:helix-turn-helix domain-containing protein [Acidimicrobiaceae bacterium]
MEEIKPDNKDFRIAELHVEGLSNPQIAKALGLNRSTVYRRLQTPQCKGVINQIRNIYHNSLMARMHNLAVKQLMFMTRKSQKETLLQET